MVTTNTACTLVEHAAPPPHDDMCAAPMSLLAACLFVYSGRGEGGRRDAGGAGIYVEYRPMETGLGCSRWHGWGMEILCSVQCARPCRRPAARNWHGTGVEIDLLCYGWPGSVHARPPEWSRAAHGIASAVGCGNDMTPSVSLLYRRADVLQTCLVLPVLCSKNKIRLSSPAPRRARAHPVAARRSAAWHACCSNHNNNINNININTNNQ
ncbi:hypothetical protein EDC01DRAFT_476563 [Geopyxis carbonaria]|nr:hypothetical protein EDC01DRAFT_476563 [Geopyxis carbonaria]